MDAKAKCKKEGMRLAVLNGSKELENVVDYLTYVGKQMISQYVINLLKIYKVI
jgi:hypothetical protein